MKDIIGCGLGLRLEFLDEVYNFDKTELPNWFEIAPENWIDINPLLIKKLEKIASDFPLVAHGLSLSIGSIEPLNIDFIKLIKEFLNRFGIKHYSEHLSFSSLNSRQLYELLPVPMTLNVAKVIGTKAKALRDILDMEIILENPTYYYVPYAEMSEIDFTNAVLEFSEATLLLDVNNVFVNAHNHKFSAHSFIDAIDMDKVSYLHVAGHWDRKDDMWIDTHGMPVKDDVWDLLKYTLQKKQLPTLLERDNNIPPLKTLLKEYQKCCTIFEESLC
ncbi:MAG: hypothetical protein RL154_90 [Pseudomonadota bacterium]|jgi:uncharacterized protein (UPF0276 family)